MTGTRWFALIAALLALGFAASGYFYLRSQDADFDAHARAIETFGRARHLDRLLSEQVLEARFGLLNQYDPLNRSERELSAASDELRSRLQNVLVLDPELLAALAKYDAARKERGAAVEQFKAENSVLKNSLRYLPMAADESVQSLQAGEGAEARAHVVGEVQALARATLVYNLIGDRSTRDALERAAARVAAARGSVPADQASNLDLLLAHARVIAERQPTVDGWLRKGSSDVVSDRLNEAERLYEARFSRAAASANRYRQLLYGWSLCLIVLAALAGLQLRRVYAGLDRRVAERTRELNEAVDALWGEMKLARKIQEALVPTAPTLAGCEVAASMKPAEQVGGDYYDVIRAQGHEWILIGDVSGHGVPAGLVMMMCQTAVRTAVARDPGMTPDRLLVLVNAVLTENIRQLGEDKYMTISALRRDPDGKIAFAGAHQDIFVYRAESDEVETHATSGLWLGLKPNAEGAFETRELRLGPNDVLFLYTDGVTEARRDGALFDTAGVRRTLAAAKGKTAQQVLDGVLGALDGFELSDDMTLLVVRQLEGDAKSERAGRATGTADATW